MILISDRFRLRFPKWHRYLADSGRQSVVPGGAQRLLMAYYALTGTDRCSRVRRAGARDGAMHGAGVANSRAATILASISVGCIAVLYCSARPWLSESSGGY